MTELNMTELVDGLARFGWSLAIAVLIVAVGIRLVRMLRRFLKKTFDRTSMDVSVSRFLLSLTETAGYALVIFIAAEKLGVPSASIVALLGSAGLAVGLSLQGSLANVAGGILILLTRPFCVGDYIKCEAAEGTVNSIGLVYTTLMTIDNQVITIPNGTISNMVVTNTTAQEKRRLNLEIRVSYRSDIRQAKAVLQQIFEEHPCILKDDGILVFVSELAENAVIVVVRGWTWRDDYWNTRWEILETIKETFDAEGIEIPFNQVKVNISSLAFSKRM